MRFILNFIFFGILFYLIWLYFPEAFHTLQSWADAIVHWVKDMFQLLMEKIGTATSPAPAPVPPVK